MDSQIDQKSHLLVTFSRHVFRTRFGEAKKVKIMVSSRRYAHFQRSKGVKKTPKKHPKNTPKPPKTIVKIDSFFLNYFVRILVQFWRLKWLQNGSKSQKNDEQKKTFFFQGARGRPTLVLTSVLEPFWRPKWHQNPKKNNQKKRLDFNYRF